METNYDHQASAAYRMLGALSEYIGENWPAIRQANDAQQMEVVQTDFLSLGQLTRNGCELMREAMQLFKDMEQEAIFFKGDAVQNMLRGAVKLCKVLKERSATPFGQLATLQGMLVSPSQTLTPQDAMQQVAPLIQQGKTIA